MGISDELARQFAKQNVRKSTGDTGKTVTGTAVKYNGSMYVQIDGSDQLTPIISSTVGMKDGDRVTVLIKDHTTTVTGNTSSPSVNQDDIDGANQEIVDKITEVEILVAEKASIKDLEAESARIDDLVADNVTIKDTLTASKAEIDQLKAKDVEITGSLTAQNAEIENLKATKLDVDVADIKYATVENLEATNADIHNLQADYGEFKQLSTDKFAANDAEIKRLDAEKASITDLDAKYANIDFANIGKAAIENFFSKSGMIGDLVVGEGTVTGTLVGVTIKGDLIEGGTVKADKLVIKGEDGLYYKLNTNGETVGAQQTEYNSLNGGIITAKSITAEKVNVNDLVAFGATIGGFHITDSAVYSGVKESIDNTTRGTYMDDDGQFAIGDGSNYLKFFKDTDGKYKLDISAASIKMGSSSLDQYVDDKVNSAVEGLDISVNVGARNYIANTEFQDISEYKLFNDGGILEMTDNGLKYTADGTTENGIVFDLSEKGSLIGNEKYMLSFEYRTNMESFGFIYAIQETAPNIPIYFSKNPVISETNWQKFEYNISNADINVRNIVGIIFPYVQSGWVEIKSKSLKLERGTVATDWTPAPEDVQTDIGDIQDSVNDSNHKVDQAVSDVKYAQSQIEILNNSISSLVVDQNGGSLMTQTPDGWQFNIGGIQSDLSAAISGVDEVKGNIDNVTELAEKTNQLANDLAEKTAYINMSQDESGKPLLELGQRDGEFKIRITNTSMDFMQGSQRIAYLSNRQLYIQSSVVTDEMKIGATSGYIWKKRENGNMGLRYVGE